MAEEYNPYPNNGQYFAPIVPPAQQKAKEDERDEILAQVPLLKKVIGRLDDRIAATDSIKQAHAVAEKYGTSRENALIGLDIARQQLEVERSYLTGQIEKLK
jgi:hypothetical protein